MASKARIEIDETEPAEDAEVEFYFRVVGANNETLVVSETFTRRADAARAADRLVGVILGIAATRIDLIGTVAE